MAGDELFKKFRIEVTPTTMLLDPDGNVLDWIVGYQPPSDRFVATLDKSAKGIDTVKMLSERSAKNPRDAEAVFKLGLKYEDIFWNDKALEKWKEGIALDPEGKTGTFFARSVRARVTYTEYAEYQLALANSRAGGKRNPEAIKAFIGKYPDSELNQRAYLMLASQMSSAPNDEAAKFYEEVVRKYPEDSNLLLWYLRFIVRSKDNVERGEELGEKLLYLNQYKSVIESFYKTLAELYLLKGDKVTAQQVYGPDTIKSRTRILSLDLVRYADFWAGLNENRQSCLDAIDMAFRITPDETTVVLMAATAYMKMKLEDKAIALVGPEYAKKHWNDGDKLWNYANFWTTQGRHLDEAVAAAKRIVELTPRHYSGWDMLGQAYAKQKNYREAIKAAEKAVELADGSTKDYVKQRLDQIKAAAAKDKT